jgi:predicted RNA binding protein YcfA (HicA-like mRNA interferase family)
VLERQGFRIVRQRGSHIVLQRRTSETTVTTVVPNHKEMAPGTLRSILKRTGLPIEDLLKLLTVLAGVTPRFW